MKIHDPIDPFKIPLEKDNTAGEAQNDNRGDEIYDLDLVFQNRDAEFSERTFSTLCLLTRACGTWTNCTACADCTVKNC